MLPFVDPIIIYLVAVVAGFVLQTVLHGIHRMGFYTIMGLIAGFTIAEFSLFLPLAVCLGISLKIIIGKYYHCLAMVGLFILAGYLVGHYVI